MRRFVFHHRSSLCVACATITCLLGCSDHPQVKYEDIPEHRSIEADVGTQGKAMAAVGQPTGTPTHRMLVAVLRRANKAWFLKGVAKIDQFNDQLIGQFHLLIKSIRFSSDDQPSWQLPDEWQQEAGSGMRFATLRCGDVEFSVIPLPVPEGDESKYLLSNVVRWQRQLQLPPIEADQLDNKTQRIDSADGSRAMLVDLRGWQSANEMKSLLSGVSRNLPANHPPIDTALGARSPTGLTYEVPAGWQETEPGGMRQAAFQVTAGDQEIEITVIYLAGKAGDLLENVNRWRKQVGLQPLASADEIDTAEINVDGKVATYVRIEGSNKRAIWVTIVPIQERVWFLKLTGDLQLAEHEEPAFRSFIDTIRFGD